jgi:MazG C-terminal domain
VRADQEDRAEARTWLAAYARTTSSTNVLPRDVALPALFAAGLVGEMGGILAEIKKAAREGPAYPRYRHRLREELGDFLWYFVRIIDTMGVGFERFRPVTDEGPASEPVLQRALRLSATVGKVAGLLAGSAPLRRTDVLSMRLVEIWQLLEGVAAQAGIDLEAAARENIAKALSRWPGEREHHPLFDDAYPEEERLPRRLVIEFRERTASDRLQVMLRCNGLNIGDRITDNAHQLDGYRYHDVFHLAHAAHLGWSPVLRALLRCKRKSNRRVDEVEDGARAIVLEEAITAMIYGRAKELSFFEGLDHLDFDLLKMISDFTVGLEVAAVPYWQWEASILDGYRAFRTLREHRGGCVEIDLKAHRITWSASPIPVQLAATGAP